LAEGEVGFGAGGASDRVDVIDVVKVLIHGLFRAEAAGACTRPDNEFGVGGGLIAEGFGIGEIIQAIAVEVSDSERAGTLRGGDRVVAWSDSRCR
jgi:hypothetical protein